MPPPAPLASTHPDPAAAIRPAPDPAAPLPRGRFNGRRVHLIGIGGCGMSGLARMLRDLGAACSGSDGTPSPVTAALVDEGIPVGPDDGTAPGLADADLIVASAAIAIDHPARSVAAARAIPVVGYAEALGLVQAERTGISIAGTHGKSTTSSMLCHILLETGLDPGFIVGARCQQIGGGSRCGAARVPRGPYAGRPGLLVAEACEFQRSFHHHHPVIGAILNVEEDHLDIYGSIDAIVDAFAGFARRLPAAEAGGRLLVAHDGAHRRRVTAGVQARTETYGFAPGADHHVETDPGTGRARITSGGRVVCEWTNPMPGDHNAMNAAAAIIMATWCGATWTDAAAAMDAFAGLDRRADRLGERVVPGGRAIVYDDYGHHPTEIDATLRALRAREQPRRVICVFQPHQHSRTRFLLDEFTRAFGGADVVMVPQIYFVRDSEIERTLVSAADLVDRLRGVGVTAMHLHPFEAIVEQLDVMARDGDLIVVMGAGPVDAIARAFMQSGDAIDRSGTAAPLATVAAAATPTRSGARPDQSLAAVLTAGATCQASSAAAVESGRTAAGVAGAGEDVGDGPGERSGEHSGVHPGSSTDPSAC